MRLTKGLEKKHSMDAIETGNVKRIVIVLKVSGKV